MNAHKHANILAVQTYGYIENEFDLSVGAVGSRARLLYVAMLVMAGKIPRENLMAVFPQGISKTDPCGKNLSDVSLGDSMISYLKIRPEMAGVKYKSESMGWGTLQDVRNTYELVRLLGYQTAHIHFVTDPVHLERVRLVWDKTHPEGWTATFHAATFHRMSWFERWVREPLARLVYWWKLSR